MMGDQPTYIIQEGQRRVAGERAPARVLNAAEEFDGAPVAEAPGVPSRKSNREAGLTPGQRRVLAAARKLRPEGGLLTDREIAESLQMRPAAIYCHRAKIATRFPDLWIWKPNQSGWRWKKRNT